MQVYQTDSQGFFVGISRADPDPLISGEWLIPGGCVTVEPPALNEGQRAQWADSKWVIVDPEPEPEPEPDPKPTYEELLEQSQMQRQFAYQQEADPLFFKWQRGSATKQEWLDKVAEIKLRHPDPEAPQ